jgi:hypothetical protein
MASRDSEVLVTTIRNTTAMIDTGTESGILALSILGASQAKALAPVNKKVGVGGQLRNSIQYITGTGKKGGKNDSPGDQSDGSLAVSLRRYEAAIGATANYATYVEFGTRFQAPQVYLRSSLALMAGVSANIITAKMNAEFAKGPLRYGQKRTRF